MAIIVVLNKQNLATLHNTDTQLVALNQASIIQISHSRDDIASMVVFLCSDAARFCNMQTFTVDGGQTAH